MSNNKTPDKNKWILIVASDDKENWYNDLIGHVKPICKGFVPDGYSSDIGAVSQSDATEVSMVNKDGFVYVVSDEMPVTVNWYFDDTNSLRKTIIQDKAYWEVRKHYKFIVATNDPALIKDGVMELHNPEAFTPAEEKISDNDAIAMAKIEDKLEHGGIYTQFNVQRKDGFVFVHCRNTDGAATRMIISKPPAPADEGEKTEAVKEETIGSLLSAAMKLHELNIDNVAQVIGLPKDILQELVNDEYYTNSVPVRLFKNLILSLHIPLPKIEKAMLPTFKVLIEKETPESIKKKKQGYKLWENEESVIKYTNRLREIFNEPDPTTLQPVSLNDEQWDKDFNVVANEYAERV